MEWLAEFGALAMHALYIGDSAPANWERSGSLAVPS